MSENNNPAGQSNGHSIYRADLTVPEICYAKKWFLEFTFRRAAITIATYHCARGECSRAREFLQQIIEDDQQDEETRFIFAAVLNDLGLEE